MIVSRLASGRALVLLGLLGLVLTGCSGEDPTATTGESGGAPEAEVDLGALLANADLKRGETLFFQCRACHSLEEGAPNKVGPNLWNMFDRKVGLAPGFAYSDALVNSDVVWTPETVSPWLHMPSRFLPGNRMIFVGVKKAQDRANLIAYLQQETGAATE